MTTPTAPLELTFDESGILCHVLMRAILQSGGIDKQPAIVLAIYEKLAKCNDEARAKEYPG